MDDDAARAEQARQQRRREASASLWQAERDLREDIFARLRAHDFDGARSTLIARLDASGCHDFNAVRAARITVAPDLVVELIEMVVEDVRRRGKLGMLTAVGLDYSDAGVTPKHPVPSLELFGYSDSMFPFSTTGDVELAAAAAADGSVPWQGGFDWSVEDAACGLIGLGDAMLALNGAHRSEADRLVERDGTFAPSPRALALQAAELLVGEIFHRFMHEALRGLRLSVPLVLLAGANDKPNICDLTYRAA